MTHRIVICDDEVHITRAVGMKLTKAGFQVEAVSDGLAALEIIRRNPPDLLITDCQMPRMGGIELARHLRAEWSTSNLPIIMLTAKGYEFDGAQLQTEFWISHIMMKPFSPRELLTKVQQTLGLPVRSAP
jgi:DNA-binding response OmpR family regulator